MVYSASYTTVCSTLDKSLYDAQRAFFPLLISAFRIGTVLNRVQIIHGRKPSPTSDRRAMSLAGKNWRIKGGKRD